jgi:hypothetical protein
MGVELTLREGCRLRVFENRLLRGIFGPERDKVTGKWKRLQNEELNDGKGKGKGRFSGFIRY